MDRSTIINMYNASNLPFATSTIFVALATFAGTMKLIRSMTNDVLPSSARSYLESAIHYLITPTWNRITIVVNEFHNDMSRNLVYDAAEVYLRTKISPHTKRLQVGKTPQQASLSVSVERGQVIHDKFNNDMELKWRLLSNESPNQIGRENRFFELSFNKKFKANRVLNEYLPFVLAQAKEITDNAGKVIKLYTINYSFGNNESGFGGGGGGGGVGWGSINLDHPATFDKLGMDLELRDAIVKDLREFLWGKELYKKVGKARKRCYLLYGPPGASKSSLIAAMANYLKFDVYDLELTSLCSNSELRCLLMSTTNRSIIVIRDVDFCVGMHEDHLSGTLQPYEPHKKVSLPCLLSFIDGLWLNCGDKRIIVFTTNYSYKLDPILLCPGLMDMHIHMSCCTHQVFKLLASNYLGIHECHTLFGEIEGLLENENVTIAEVAEELRKSENADIALRGVVNLLKRKKMEAQEIEQDRTHGFHVEK